MAKCVKKQDISSEIILKNQENPCPAGKLYFYSNKIYFKRILLHYLNKKCYIQGNFTRENIFSEISKYFQYYSFACQLVAWKCPCQEQSIPVSNKKAKNVYSFNNYHMQFLAIALCYFKYTSLKTLIPKRCVLSNLSKILN